MDVRFDPYKTTNYDEFFIFSVNPLGTKSAKFGAGRGQKAEWQGDWDAAAKRNPEGWAAEMRIPWNSLNYPKGKGKGTFGLNFYRNLYRTQTESVWSQVGAQYFNENQGLWTDVVAPAPPRPKVTLLPYVLGGLDRRGPILRSGVDARYPITPDLTAVASVNPDFGTIEGAVESIVFSRSERFVPERRPFFLEGANFLQEGSYYTLGRFFYSRRIPEFDLGTKLYGKVDPKDTVGFLDAERFGGRRDTVLTARHDFTPLTRATLFVSQKDEPGDRSAASVVRLASRTGKLSLNAELGASSGDAFDGRRGDGGGEVLAAYYEDLNHYSYLQFDQVSRDFRLAEGLQDFTGYRGLYWYELWYGEFRKGNIRDFNVLTEGRWDWRQDGDPFRRGGFLNAALSTRDDWAYSLGVTRQAFLGDQDLYYNASVTRGATNRFNQAGLFAETGRIAGRPYTSIGPTLSKRFLNRLDLIYSGSSQNLGGLDQLQILTVNYQLSPTRAVGGRLVVRGGRTNGYLSLRNAGGKGTEVYVILGDPNADTFKGVVQIKAVFVR